VFNNGITNRHLLATDGAKDVEFVFLLNLVAVLHSLITFATISAATIPITIASGSTTGFNESTCVKSAFAITYAPINASNASKSSM
jgi:hypothetical protein